jgi:hypothetical protein
MSTPVNAKEKARALLTTEHAPRGRRTQNPLAKEGSSMRTLAFQRYRVEPLIFVNRNYQRLLAERLHCRLLRPFICSLCRCLALDPIGWNGRGLPLCEACACAEGGVR